MTVIIASAGVMYLSDFYQNNTLESEYFRIIYSLRSARIKSMQQEENSQWGIHFDNSSLTPFYAEFKGDSYLSGISVQKTYLSDQVRFLIPASAAFLDVSFEKISGAPVPSSSTTITIALKKDSSKKKSVTISRDNGIE